MTLSRSLYRSFGLLLFLLLCLTGFSLFNFRRLSDADQWKTHTYQVMQNIHRVSKSLEAMDAGVRAVIVENTPEAKRVYLKGMSDSERELKKLDAQTGDRPSYKEDIDRIRTVRDAWNRNYLLPLIAMRARVADDGEALQQSREWLVGRRRGLNEMSAILDQMESTEEELLKQRSEDQERWQALTEITLWTGAAFSIILATFLATLVSGASKKLDAANAHLTDANTQLASTNEQVSTANAQLSAEIAQRRAAETKLQQTVTELERSNAELEQFAYVASHDLQEPLRAVAGCVQVLKKRYSGQLDARADQFIEHAVDGAQRMQNLINDLLSYSRVGTKGKPFVAVSMEKVLARATVNISEAINDSGAQVTHDQMPDVMGDAQQLEQVLQNLMSNAIKFRGEVTPQVHIIYRFEDEHHVFGVRDNGLGIEPQYFERIFVMFQRLHTRAEYPGTGIGLAICKKIVERHHGKIGVESAPGKGTTFWFSIAAHLEETQGDPEKVEEKPTSAPLSLAN